MDPNQLKPGEVINVGKSAVLAHSTLCQKCEVTTRGYLFLRDGDVWWFVCSVCESAQEY
jgi:hypothetical protein